MALLEEQLQEAHEAHTQMAAQLLEAGRRSIELAEARGQVRCEHTW